MNSPRRSSKPVDLVIDRYIPRNTSQRTYNSCDTPTRISNSNFFIDLRSTGHYMQIETSRPGSTASSTRNSSVRVPEDNLITQTDIVAEILGFTHSSRVFDFSPPRKQSFLNLVDAESASPFALRVDPWISNLTPYQAIFYCAKKKETANKALKKPIAKSFPPYRVLDAPSLRNDFYSNLVAWSKHGNKIAVALNAQVYLWSEDEGALPLNTHLREIVTCVSFSESGSLVVATKTGRLSLFTEDSNYAKCENACLGKGVCTITWFPNDDNKFLVGDESGDVTCFNIECSDTRRNNVSLYQIKRYTQFKCQQQQVCGIAINSSANQLAVGGNDNSCTIWDIKNLTTPKLKFILPHHAAVKAVSYCPWSKSLLMTGGGSKDRTIRFWHTTSGTLLDSLRTNGQITSLIWSNRRKQFAATFGFSEVNPLLVSVYSYPNLEQLVKVNATASLRVLSGVKSPDGTALCVATNDETVRFYQIWDPNEVKIAEAHEGAVYGSDLIAYCEGINKHGTSIR